MAVTMRTSALTRRRFLDAGASSTATRRRRHREACSQPRRRPAPHHPRRPVRRRLDRCRDCVGACGQAVAHAGRGRDHRQLQECSRRRLRRCAAGDRFHRQGADRGSAGRAGYVLSHQVSGPFVPHASERAADRTFSDRPERAAQRLVRVVGRHRRRLGDRRGARRDAHICHHAEMPARFFHSFRRSHLCRLSDPGGAEAAGRRRVEEHRDRGEIQDRPDARGVSRQLQIQPARQEPARVQCRGAAACAMG